MDQSTPELSIVIPVYNEVDNLAPLQIEIDTHVKSLGLSYEVIYVNDGSSDGSRDELSKICSSHPEVIAIDLRRNFGQTAAIAAGINNSHGSIVILMDADLQNDPADIALLLNKLGEGYDVVSGWRQNRRDRFLNRRLPSVIANWLISEVTQVRLHDYGCTLKAYRREVIDEVRLYGEMHRFIPVFASAAGAKVTEIVVNHRPRLRGKSKYGITRTTKVVLDLITVKFLLDYRTTPMYLFGGVGVAFISLSIVTILIALFDKMVNGISLIQTPLPSLAATLLGLGVQSILLGLTTEVLMRTYYEAQGKPTYIVQRIRHNRISKS
jgi:glycosyltransferase involved in cell wall biosynthesis